jgi:endonuclease-8
MNAALAGHEIGLAEAPDPRSPVHGRAATLEGRTFERAEARGKHLLAHLSGEVVVHSHLGINGRWFISSDGRRPYGRAWLVLAAGRAIASQAGGKLLRIVSASRARNDLGLMQLGPDPLRPGFDLESAAARLLEAGRGREAGDALLDQRIIAGIGNAIRTEACFEAGIDPWRRVDELDSEEAVRLVHANQRVMQVSLRKGRRPRSIYRATARGCPRCGTKIRSRGQGDANRTAYWCPSCQS